jgi:transcription factor E
MLKKFLEEVVVVVVGKQAEPIADLLFSKKHVNEFLIAKKLEITINQTRNILYKLSDYGLVSSIRKKDKKKGWYTYFWRTEVLKSLEFLKSTLLKNLEQFNNQIKSRETKQFYVCERCNIEFTEEHALLNDFTCNECGGIFTSKDNTKLLREFKRNVDRMNKKLELIEVEIVIENSKLEKEKEKEFKKLKKEKDEKRKLAAKKRAATRKAKEKLENKGTKKGAKKKVAKKKVVKKRLTKKKVKKIAKKKSTKKKIPKKIKKKKIMAKKK